MLNYFCEACDQDSVLLTIDEVSATVKTSRRTIYNWITKGRLHLMKDGGGRTLICKRSLIVPYTKGR